MLTIYNINLHRTKITTLDTSWLNFIVPPPSCGLEHIFPHFFKLKREETQTASAAEKKCESSYEKCFSFVYFWHIIPSTLLMMRTTTVDICTACQADGCPNHHHVLNFIPLGLFLEWCLLSHEDCGYVHWILSHQMQKKRKKVRSNSWLTECTLDLYILYSALQSFGYSRGRRPRDNQISWGDYLA